jgi:hypothetical protein
MWQIPLFQEIHTPRGIEYRAGMPIRAQWYVIPVRKDDGMWREQYAAKANTNLQVWELVSEVKRPPPPAFEPDEDGVCHCELCEQVRSSRCPCCGF